jgi:hypothetical protein
MGALKTERIFLFFIMVGFILVGIAAQNVFLGMWLGFMIAGYSTIANDSIQTIGTFLASNLKRPWWILWLYVAGILVATMFYSWYTLDGDVSYARLTSKGFETAPTEFSYLQIAAPLFLLILTRIRMPVSTTFLILSCFSTSSNGIVGILTKSLSGYVVAFTGAFILWIVLSKQIDKWFKGEASPIWIVLQWITSGGLWMVWLMQDAANIAVYLPRKLAFGEFVFFVLYLVAGLGVLFYLKGDRIQSVIMEKSKITDIRGATVVDFIYAFILFYFKAVSVIPMSTTWVFLGLLAGRELAMTIRGMGEKNMTQAFKVVGRDVLFAGIGLIVSILLAIAINPLIKDEVFGFFQ